ncbi:hypothetical protein Taro_007607 [Colocasia esculenta]|uniref:Malectin domain-containing protein n=1 Tax=Colocasia esculenta TaxID=4460 RepID=A0A843TVZ2_COLES|nr:hypothetical protein [Colocasia esculenta]
MVTSMSDVPDLPALATSLIQQSRKNLPLSLSFAEAMVWVVLLLQKLWQPQLASLPSLFANLCLNRDQQCKFSDGPPLSFLSITHSTSTSQNTHMMKNLLKTKKKLDGSTFMGMSSDSQIMSLFSVGEKVLTDFNIAEAANGTGKEIVKNFTAHVEKGTLEIHFQWLGKGTNAIPDRGSYGPLISAISILHVNWIRRRIKLSVGAVVGIAVASECADNADLAFCVVLPEKEKTRE